MLAMGQMLEEERMRQKYTDLASDNDLKSIVKIARTLRKDMKRQARLKAADTKSELDMGVCVECEEIIKLTKEVNQILEKTEEGSDPESVTSLELGNLKAMATFTEYVDDNNKLNCLESLSNNLSDDFLSINDEELNLEFSEEVLIRFKSGQFWNSNNQRKTIWLRGTGKDLNKVVKIEIDKFNRQRLSLYTIEVEDPTIPVERVKKKDYKLPGGKTKNYTETSTKEKTSGELDYTADYEWRSSESDDYLKMSVGADIEYKYYVPDYISVLSVQAENEFFDRFKVKSKVDVNTKRQKAEFTVIDGNDSDELFTVTAKANKASLSVPYDVDIFEDYYIKGNMGIDTEGTQSLSAAIMDGKDEVLRSKYGVSSSGEEYMSVSATRKLSKNSVLSLKFEKREAQQLNEDHESVWVSYRLRF